MAHSLETNFYCQIFSFFIAKTCFLLLYESFFLRQVCFCFILVVPASSLHLKTQSLTASLQVGNMYSEPSTAPCAFYEVLQLSLNRHRNQKVNSFWVCVARRTFRNPCQRYASEFCSKSLLTRMA